jgi:hypothetical protein
MCSRAAAFNPNGSLETSPITITDEKAVGIFDGGKHPNSRKDPNTKIQDPEKPRIPNFNHQ